MPFCDPVTATAKNWLKWRASEWPALAGLSEGALAAAEIVAAKATTLASMMREAPQTMVHWDARPDNCFFGTPSGGAMTAVLIDWQTVGVGKGTIDVAKMIIPETEPSMPGVVEWHRTLLSAYHTELCKHLPRGAAALYPFEACWRDYRMGAASCLQSATVWASVNLKDEPNPRTRHLAVRMQRYVGCLPDLNVSALFE